MKALVFFDAGFEGDEQRIPVAEFTKAKLVLGIDTAVLFCAWPMCRQDVLNARAAGLKVVVMGSPFVFYDRKTKPEHILRAWTAYKEMKTAGASQVIICHEEGIFAEQADVFLPWLADGARAAKLEPVILIDDPHNTTPEGPGPLSQKYAFNFDCKVWAEIRSSGDVEGLWNMLALRKDRTDGLCLQLAGKPDGTGLTPRPLDTPCAKALFEGLMACPDDIILWAWWTGLDGWVNVCDQPALCAAFKKFWPVRSRVLGFLKGITI